MAKGKKVTKKFVDAGIGKLAKSQEETGEEFKEKETAIARKIERVSDTIDPEETVGPLDKFLAKIELLFDCAKDYWDGVYKDIPWYSIAAIVFALLYFLDPVDLIPDFIPVIGYVDDASVLLLVWKGIESDLKKYAEWKEVEVEEYF